MIQRGEKIYLPGVHFPWSLQKDYDWNYQRAEMYLTVMLEKRKEKYISFDPSHPENVAVVDELNVRLSKN
jgi:hypothetical protein